MWAKATQSEVKQFGQVKISAVKFQVKLSAKRKVFHVLPNPVSVFLCPVQQYSRGNNTVQANSLKDLLQNKIDDMEKQVLSRVNTLEESKPGSRNDSEQRNRVESTLTSLHHRITDLEKGAFGL